MSNTNYQPPQKQKPKTLAIIINIFFPGIGTLIMGKTIQGIIQILINIVAIAIFVLTLGFGVIISAPLGFIAWLWGLISVATA